MAGFADIDDAAFQAFANRVGDKIAAKQAAKEIGNGMKKLAVESQRKVSSRTPVDSGNLRRGWQIDNATYGGGSFSFTLANNIEYAPFVENGHRTRGGGGWVEGQFFLKNTIVEIQGEFPTIWQPIFDNALRGLLD